MSEVLAQLEKKGGGIGDGQWYLVDFPSLVRNTPTTLSIEKSTPNITQMVAIVFNGNDVVSVGMFSVADTTITLDHQYINGWYNTYYWLTISGDQLTVRQTYTTGNGARILVFYT